MGHFRSWPIRRLPRTLYAVISTSSAYCNRQVQCCQCCAVLKVRRIENFTSMSTYHIESVSGTCFDVTPVIRGFHLRLSPRTAFRMRFGLHPTVMGLQRVIREWHFFSSECSLIINVYRQRRNIINQLRVQRHATDLSNHSKQWESSMN